MNPPKPDFVIPVQSIGVVVYPETKTIGVQFIDPSKKSVFVSLSGQALSALGRDIARALTENPEAKQWQMFFPAQGKTN